MRSFVTAVTLVLNIASMIGMVAGILLHSGAAAASRTCSAAPAPRPSARRLPSATSPRITTVFALVWFFTVIALGFLLVKY